MLEDAPDMRVADAARRAGCSFATAWQVVQDFQLLRNEHGERFHPAQGRIHDSAHHPPRRNPRLQPIHRRDLLPHPLGALLPRLNELAASHDLGRLQALRSEMKGLARRPTISPFPSEPNDPDWAFHVGGRQELQFNIGHDVDVVVGRPGNLVAFELERGGAVRIVGEWPDEPLA